MSSRRRRDVVLHDDGSLSWTVDAGDDSKAEWKIKIDPPKGDYEPVFPEQAEWLRQRRARRPRRSERRLSQDMAGRELH